MNNKIDIVFPCAGKGERFGSVFKPLLKIGDLTFIEKAYQPFSKWEKYIENIYFLVTQEQEQQNKFYDFLVTRFPKEKVKVILLREETSGPLQTFSKTYLDLKSNNNGFIVCDCDHSIDVDPIFSRLLATDPDIVIPVWDIKPEEHKNWSKIISKDSNIVDFKNKELIDTTECEVRGIIGCVYYKNVLDFQCIEEQQTEFYQVIKAAFKRGRQISFVSPRKAYFFGDPDMLRNCIEQRRNECTIFCDIDGVLFKHRDHSTCDPDENETLKGVQQLKQLYKDHMIVLTTARSEKFRDQLVHLLEAKNVPFDKLVMGLPSGPRVLVNDRKPSKPFTRQATACEIFRNDGLVDFNLTSVLQSNSYSIVADLSANSLAKTYLISNNQKKFVRKVVPRSSGEKHVQILKRQMHDLDRLNFLHPGLCPQVLTHGEDSLSCFYDMEYMEGYKELSQFEWEDKKDGILKTLETMNDKVYTLCKKVDPQDWMSEFLDLKIYPKFDSFSEMNDVFNSIINSDTLCVNGKKYLGLRKAIQASLELDLGPRMICPVHGDLTLENVLYDPNTGDIKLIDMDGSRLFDAPELDLGKMSQSIVAKYSSWKDAPAKEIVFKIDVGKNDFEINPSFSLRNLDKSVKLLLNKWSEILDQPFDLVERKSYFYMSTYFIRFVPFRLQKNLDHGIFALLMAVIWLNKAIGENNEN